LSAAVEKTPPVRTPRKPRTQTGKPRVRLALAAAFAGLVLGSGGWWMYEEFGAGRATSVILTPSPTASSPSPSVSASPSATIVKAKSFRMVVPPGVTVTESSEDRVQIYAGFPSETYSMEWLGRGKLQDIATKARKDDAFSPAQAPKIDYVAGAAFWQYDLEEPCSTEPLAAKWCFRGHHMRVVAPAGNGFVLVTHARITKIGPLNRNYPSRDALIASAKEFAGAVK
jgi:hypothetical protein